MVAQFCYRSWSVEASNSGESDPTLVAALFAIMTLQNLHHAVASRRDLLAKKERLSHLLGEC